MQNDLTQLLAKAHLYDRLLVYAVLLFCLSISCLRSHVK